MSLALKGLSFTDNVNNTNAQLKSSFAQSGKFNSGSIPPLTTSALTTVSNLSTLGKNNNVLNLNSHFTKSGTNWGLQTTNFHGTNNVFSKIQPTINTISNTAHVAMVHQTNNKPSDPTRNLLNTVITNGALGVLDSTGLSNAPDLLHPIAVGLFKATGIEPITPYQHALASDAQKYASNLKEIADPNNWLKLIKGSTEDIGNTLLTSAANHIQDLAAPYRAANFLSNIVTGNISAEKYLNHLSGKVKDTYNTLASHVKELGDGNLEAIGHTASFTGFIAGSLVSRRTPFSNPWSNKPFDGTAVAHSFDIGQRALMEQTKVGAGRNTVSLDAALKALSKPESFSRSTQDAGRIQRIPGNFSHPQSLSQDIVWALENQRTHMGDQVVVSALNKHLSETGENAFNNTLLKEYRDELVKLNKPKTDIAPAPGTVAAATKLEAPRDVYQINEKGQVIIQTEFKDAKLTDAQRQTMAETLAGAQNTLKNELPKSYIWRGTTYKLDVVDLDSVGKGALKRGSIDPDAKPIFELMGDARREAIDAMQDLGNIANKKLFGGAWADGALKTTDAKSGDWTIFFDTTRLRVTTDSANRVTGFVIPDDAIRFAPSLTN